MDVEFRPLTEDDIDQVLRLRAIAFGQFGDREGYLASVTWRLPYSLGAFSGGRLRSMSIMIPFEAYVAGRRVTVGGLSGVATAPEARRLGLVAKGLRRWFEDLRERGVGWSTEHPFDPTFYARLGYQTVPNGHTLELPLPRLKAAARGATWEGGLVAEPAGPEAAPALARVFAPWARRFSFALTREDGLKPYWDWTFRRPYGDVTHVAYVADDAYAVLTVKDEDGRPEGRTVLVVRDLAYSSPAGRRRVLALLASFEGQADAVRLHLPRRATRSPPTGPRTTPSARPSCRCAWSTWPRPWAACRGPPTTGSSSASPTPTAPGTTARSSSRRAPRRRKDAPGRRAAHPGAGPAAPGPRLGP